MAIETGEVAVLHAKAVLLTAASAEVYIESTNALISSADGLGMAARASISFTRHGILAISSNWPT